MRSWLEQGSFYIGPGSTGDRVKLEGASLSDIGPFLTWDYERFALASLESLLELSNKPKRPKALGWPLLKLYYAAFFGAHAIMRAVGCGIVRLEKKQATSLSEIAGVFSLSISVSAGNFEFQVGQGTDGTLSILVSRLLDSGGAHDQFWRRFYIFLGEISNVVVINNEPGAAQVVSEISDLQNALSAKGLSGGTWLSTVRNELNYQHQYGVWFPYYGSVGKVYAIRDNSSLEGSRIRRDIDPNKKPLDAFSATCLMVCAINKEVAKIVAHKRSANRFARVWQRLEHGS